MKCENDCGLCPYLKRCRPNPMKIITIYNRMCKEWYEEHSSGMYCVKYNPILMECKSLALNTFKNRHNLSCNNSEAIKSKIDVEECFEIFKEIFEYIVSLE